MCDVPLYPPPPAPGRLLDAWNQPLRSIIQRPAPPFDDGMKERHTLYSLLVYALVAAYWNGNKYGSVGPYPWRQGQMLPNGSYQGGDYQGHNIGCIGVNGRGQVMDFDFNHNSLFDSSVEHAESRLVRRLFSLTQLQDEWVKRGFRGPVPIGSYGNSLKEVTLYTSLESCAQCSGIMTLGEVKEVVFLQHDDSQSNIGNVLYGLGQLNGSSFTPALPISADSFGCDYFNQLGEAYLSFKSATAQKPFCPSNPGDWSITSFLCTDNALAIFTAAAKQLQVLKAADLRCPDYRPPAVASAPSSADSTTLVTVMSNAEVLDEVKSFLDYAVNCAHRGTPHST